MKYIETAFEIKRSIEFHNTITKFCLLGMFFHILLCRKEGCRTCTFLCDFVNFLLWSISSAEEKISFFHNCCRKNHEEFYSNYNLILSLAEEERKNYKSKR